MMGRDGDRSQPGQGSGHPGVGAGAPRRPGHRLAAAALAWLGRLPASRPATALLVLVNAVGSIWGFWWYRDQLLATPAWQWPVVPDSPTASTLFTMVLVLQLARRPVPALASWAYLVMIKYGLWTVVVLGGYALRAGFVDGEAALLIASHAGMALEALLYLRAYPGSLRGVGAATAWSLFNDAVDYLAGLHPTLPGPEVWGLAAASAPLLTGLGAAAVLHGARRARPAGP